MTRRRLTSPATEDEYLRLVERLAKDVVEHAVQENAFEVFVDGGYKTPLQAAISELARCLRYRHDKDDECTADQG